MIGIDTILSIENLFEVSNVLCMKGGINVEKSLLLKNKDLLSIKPLEREECMFADVYDRHIDTIYRVCFSMMGNKQDAEDAAQSVVHQADTN